MVIVKHKCFTISRHVTQRGWTTWLTGAVDKRVVAIVPVVMDELNFVKVCTSNAHSSVHFSIL